MKIPSFLRPRNPFKNTRAYQSFKAMPTMRRRMIVMLVTVFLILGLIFAFNQFKSFMIKKFMAGAGQMPATVTSMTVAFEEWQPKLTAVGDIRAFRGVDVSTEVGGLVDKVGVKSGAEVTQGTLLLKLNDEADVAQLKALNAQAELASLLNVRDKAQLDIQAISKNAFETSTTDMKAKKALAEQQKALVNKKSLHAPFAGRIGVVTVNPGQYVNPGDKLFTLQDIHAIYVDFTVPQNQISSIAVNQAINLNVDAFKETSFTGKITAINPKIDLNTRNIQVEALVDNAGNKLLPGMFANINVNFGKPMRALTLPQTAVTYNPYGSTVFVVKTIKSDDPQAKPKLEAEQVFVTTGATRGDQVAITKGLSEGDMVVTSGQLKLKNGTPIIVDNKFSPTNAPDPKPQEK